jgi:hypothetical protein
MVEAAPIEHHRRMVPRPTVGAVVGAAIVLAGCGKTDFVMVKRPVLPIWACGPKIGQKAGATANSILGPWSG